MEGGCRVMEVWESQAAADAFYSSALFRQITADFAEPKITAWPLYALDGSGLK
jgi:quinol monooxygenase YgiN